jgi:hypothetical protein
VENQPYEELTSQMAIMHSIAPDRLVQSGPMCDAWGTTADGVTCTGMMPEASYPLAFFGTALADGVQGVKYSDQLVAGGGRPPYRFRIQQGSFPAGLKLRADGAVLGKPQTGGTYSLTFVVTDATTPVPQTATQTMTLSIATRN